MTDQTPATAAGRALLDWWASGGDALPASPTNVAFTKAILAIEAEARALDRDALAEVPLIDSSCNCGRCRARSAEFYDLPGGCLNCGQRFIIRSRKGDKAPLSVECPACETTAYSWRALAREAPAASPEASDAR